ncbi:unnamed protein product [Prunus armeniaca]|uniref:Uncharacterized protein n=1 Tax=Prunus armeniaca TaxID=36596 RepID=A0A6J5XTQ0_PRUAR|nr:hypothetical protein GBA52_024801 [Prunus armeniaca]CAB4316471.1 unnamed protein product [Prunus armeniaca]
MNTTLQGNETRAYFTHFFEKIIQAAQEQRTPRNEDMTSRTTKASLGVTKYSQGQTSGHANSSSPNFGVESPFDVPSPPIQATNIDSTLPPVAALITSRKEEVLNHQLIPLGKAISGTLPKYLALRIGEVELPPKTSRRNMQKDGGNPHASMSILPIIMAKIRVMEEVRGITHDNLNTFRIQKIRMKQGQKLYPTTVILS